MVTFWVGVVHLVDLNTLCPLCIMSICNVVDSHFGFEGKTLVMIAPVPDHCNFFSYGQTLFAIIILHIFNK